MTPEQFLNAYPLISEWIKKTLSDHMIRVQPVISAKFSRLLLYFSRDLLTSTKFVVVDQVPVPPLSSMGLPQFADFELGEYDGITYLDTFFVRRECVSHERLYFHELIHVVQWRLLGMERFIAEYAAGLSTFGYRNSPLEVMAYEAEESFAMQSLVFNAENFVKIRLDKARSV